VAGYPMGGSQFWQLFAPVSQPPQGTTVARRRGGRVANRERRGRARRPVGAAVRAHGYTIHGGAGGASVTQPSLEWCAGGALGAAGTSGGTAWQPCFKVVELAETRCQVRLVGRRERPYPAIALSPGLPLGRYTGHYSKRAPHNQSDSVHYPEPIPNKASATQPR
jgi:hypothetical protein